MIAPPPFFSTSDTMSPTADPEVPMDYTSEYDTSDKSLMDDSDETCSIPGSFSPDNNQDGTSGDQRYEEIFNIYVKMVWRASLRWTDLQSTAAVVAMIKP